MNSVRRNVIANYVGSGWNALMGVVFTPLYIYYLGIEAFGVIGVFTLLQSWLFFLDMGITPTMSREMARFDAGAYTSQNICDLVRSLEVIYLLIALTIATVMTIGSAWLTANWLQISLLPEADVEKALSLTGFFIALRFFGGLYRGAIVGLQQQVWLNGCSSVFATMRGLGVVVILAWVSPTILAFLVFQGVMAALEAVVLAFKMHRLLPIPQESAGFRWGSLQKIWRFAAGMTANTLQILFLTQVDKLLLSKLLPLSEFGYYTLATTLAGGLFVVMGAITNVAYPRFTKLVTSGNAITLIENYHKFAQIFSVIIIPTALVLSIFSEHILLLWTHNTLITAKVAPLLSLLVIGNMLNGLTQIPYFLQLAYGWTRLNIIVNFLSMLVLIPAVYFFVPLYGAIIAPIIWIVLNIGFISLSIPIMHRRLLPAEMWRWYWQDVILPVIGALVPISIMYFLFPLPILDKPLISLIGVSLAAITGLVSVAMTTRIGRSFIYSYTKS